MGGKGVMGLSSYGAALCQHIPQTAATQSCPAGCQACVSCVISSPVLHHIHCQRKESQEIKPLQEKNKVRLGLTG